MALGPTEADRAFLDDVRGFLRATLPPAVRDRVARGMAPNGELTRFAWTPICAGRDRNDDVQHEEDRSSFSR